MTDDAVEKFCKPARRPPPIPRPRPNALAVSVIVLRAAWLALRLAGRALLVLWHGLEVVAAAIGLLVLICLGPVGWVILIVWAVSDTRERRHQELLKAIERSGGKP